jgi:hypothetical protein
MDEIPALPPQRLLGKEKNLLKTLRAWAGSMAQVIECLPSKYKVLSSNSSTKKKLRAKQMYNPVRRI